jgi:beta-lactamase superfamily II metal-dependent hydrolase
MKFIKILLCILFFPFTLTYWGFKHKNRWTLITGAILLIIFLTAPLIQPDNISDASSSAQSQLIIEDIKNTQDHSLAIEEIDFEEVNTDIIEVLVDDKNEKDSTGKILYSHFLDVGQADAIYIGYGDFDMVIDGGNNEDGPLVVNYLREQGVDDIELLVASHAHEDHIGGLDDVIKAFDVEKIIDSGQVSTTNTYKSYLHAAKSENAAFIEDDDLVFNIDENMRVEIIETGDNYSNTNDNSVLVRIVYNCVEMLFTGDMESDVEKKILNKNINADILKAGHHGSSSSSSYNFLEKVNPSYVIISAGLNNKYGHPHTESLANFLKFTDRIYGTWKSGSIIVQTDGVNIKLNTDEKVTMKDAHASIGNIGYSEPKTDGVINDPPDSANNIIENISLTESGVIISNLDKKAEYISILNTSNKDINLTGWTIVSVLGNQRFTFSEYILKSGSTIKVGDSNKNSDIIFHWLDGRGVWNNSKDDPAQLYDSSGMLVDEY